MGHEKFFSGVSDAVQPQKVATGLKFRIKEEEEFYYIFSEKQALISCLVTAQLICAFVFAYVNSGFLMTWLI